ncbi:hypothetical protein CROQUDRAFT_654086 [Cronartium quercuum f. sp. fusiforme G11]|uniref:OTU domain-containing protein n=1 Tax=Cronartium quercuum f. sp. fusiforme G11 TaxID=708437 RepID=A0A9P6NL24_9BASI|nr:hypothetical protein CROQUDRAFT_654086 [Cronartium quercuum f. sp. fusiforme G11]
MAKRDQPRRSNLRTSATAEPRQSKGRARTRASGVKLIQDPEDDDRKLGEQLAQMGLYAAHTVGDGNCLFRALSDQFYGTPEHHGRVRTDVCNYLAEHEARYRAFVDTDEEESWETRLQEMRKQGTYGGHLELSAFASLHQRPIKVIQPGMIYIIGYEDESPSASSNGKGKAKHVVSKTEANQYPTSAPLYIVYHQWEHYSSVRNLVGPHGGPPQIREDLRPCSLDQERRNSPCIDDETDLSVELSLLSRSLPEGVIYSNKQLAALIAQSGSWEKALEVILEEQEIVSGQKAIGAQTSLTSFSAADESLPLPPYREPTPSSSASTASSPADSTAPSSASVGSHAQIRKLSRSHSRSPETSDSPDPDEGIGRRLRPRRNRSSPRLLPPRDFGCLSSGSPSHASSSSLSSEGAGSPEADSSQVRPQRRRTRSSLDVPPAIDPLQTATQANFGPSSSQIEPSTRPLRNRLVSRPPSSASHSPLSKSTMNRMSKKEARQAQRRLTRAQERSSSSTSTGTPVSGRAETITLFRELRV